MDGHLARIALSYWRRDGWANYGNGRLWTVNPEDYDGLMRAWLAGTHLHRSIPTMCLPEAGLDASTCGEASGAGLNIDPVSSEVFALQNCLRPKSLARQDGGIKAFCSRGARRF